MQSSHTHRGLAWKPSKRSCFDSCKRTFRLTKEAISYANLQRIGTHAGSWNYILFQLATKWRNLYLRLAVPSTASRVEGLGVASVVLHASQKNRARHW